MSLSAIRAALEGRLARWAAEQVPPLPIAWQNVSFDPQGKPHLRASILPAVTVGSTFKSAEEKGIFQVSIYHRLNEGSGFAERLATEVARLFPAGAILDHQGALVKLPTHASIGAALPSEEFHLVPVSIRYLA